MINKDALRYKVKKAIEVMPYTGLVKREGEDKYHKPLPPEVICTLTGLKYIKESKLNVIVDNSGLSKDKEDIRFLVEWNENSILVKEGDIIEINNEKFKINYLGNTNEVCFDMKLEKI